MYHFLLGLQVLMILILMGEGLFVFFHLKSKMHSFLFLYLIANIVNCAGYLFEMTSKTTEEAYLATRMLYLGKVFIPVGMLVFILYFCRTRFPMWGAVLLCCFHGIMWLLIASNSFHHLYYTSIEFVNTGLFPHNSYGHGPLYFIYQGLLPVYFAIAIGFALKSRKYFVSKLEKSQFRAFIMSPVLALLGLVFFLSGKTAGYDTTNVGFFITSILMMTAFFRCDLIDTEDMVKNSVVDDLNDGIIATDFGGRLVYTNKKAKGLFPGALTKKTDENSGIIKDLRNKAERKERIEIGTGIYSVFIKELIRDGLFRGRLYILDDVTDVQRYTRKVEEEKEKADEANAAKSQFLSNMSHEIRTPMNAIVGMTDILLRDNLPERDQEYLNNIRNSGNALIDIINDILDFSKIESGKMEILPTEYEPLTMANDLKMIFLTRIGDKPIRLTYDIDFNLPAKLIGDAVRIRQIIINLVNNAIKFTEVGYVRLKISSDVVDKDTVCLGISVKDSGLGIKKEDIEKLFDSFTRVDSVKNHKTEGTGLGLTITKQLVELMGGEITVESEYGSGSEFSIMLPQKIADNTPASEYRYQKEEKDEARFIAPGARILVAEDNEINVKVIRGLLEPLKLNIDVAENGMAALRKITDEKYDMVLMDQMMPVMDGIEATMKIREYGGDYYEKLPIIALTANAVQGAKEELLNAGMNDYVMKPVDIKVLKSKIKKWLPQSMVIELSEEEGEKDAPKADTVKNDDPATILENMDEIKKEYGYLDSGVGITHCGSEELYEEVLKDFYNLIDNKADKIESLQKEGNIKDYTIEVHALKSVARMVGAEYLSALAFELELAGKEENKALIEEKTPELLERYRAYKASLSYFDKDDVPKIEIAPEELVDKLSKIKEAAASFDIDTIDEIMGELEHCGFDKPEVEEKMKNLYNLVRDVSFDEVTSLVDEIVLIV
ncbi:MAG: response regulator [Lachnospiraceae bacterium]|nr:response regulator [Lachnospiraceae bacterium]